MPDEPTTQPTQDTSEGEGKNTVMEQGGQTADAQATSQSGTAEPKPIFTQDDVNRIVRDRLNEEKRKAAEAVEAGKKAAEEKRLKEQGEWKLLAEQKDERIKELEAALKDRDRQVLLNKVAVEEKLPADLASRLVGETEEEIREDAKRLAKHIAPPKPPQLDLPGSGPLNNGAKKPSVEEAQSRLLASGDYQG
jgi:hypothetical protein